MFLPGFELLYSSVQPQLRSPQDAVVSAIHWNIISAGFKLTGVGENPAVERLSTETLPGGWNSGEIFILHYETTSTDHKQSYLLKILPVDGTLLSHFQRENEENVITVEIPVREFASEDLSSVTSVFRNLDRLNKVVRNSLIDPAMGNSSGRNPQGTADSSKASSSKDTKKEKTEKRSPLFIEQGGVGYMPRPMPPAWGGSPGMGGIDPFSVGRSDLDPLAGMGGGLGGGGMIMDPRHTGGPRFGGEGAFGGPARGGGIHPGALPPGAIPPGARFDHFGPPGMRPGPDPDHEQPPSGYDDMFM